MENKTSQDYDYESTRKILDEHKKKKAEQESRKNKGFEHKVSHYQEIIDNSMKKSITTAEVKKESTFGKIATRVGSAALAIVLIISGLHIGKRKTELDRQDKIDEYVVEMIDESSNANNLASYSAKRTKNVQYYYHDVELLARKIIDLEPEYFDIAIYSFYKNVNYNRSTNMDALMKQLGIYASIIKDSNPAVYHKIENVSTFNDYLIHNKFMDGNGNASLNEFEKFVKTQYKIQEDNLDVEYGGRTK